MRHETTTSYSRQTLTHSPVRMGALLVGAVFVLVGIAGFIPGITTNYDDITFASHDSEAQLLGVFQVNVLHNIVHLAFGVVGLAAARTRSWATGYLLVGGALYLVVWVYGMLVDHGEDANFLALNDADNWLHLGLGVGMIGLGLLLPMLEGPARRRVDTGTEPYTA